MSRHALQLREQPHKREHDAALVARMGDDDAVKPTSLDGLLRWFRVRWEWEVPSALHVNAVWASRVDGQGLERGEYVKPEHRGGSLIGTHAYTDPFRRYIDNTSVEVDKDKFYVRPLHRALQNLAEAKNGAPLTARFLFRVARSGFDVRRAADTYTVCRHTDGEHKAMAEVKVIRACSGMPHEYALWITERGLSSLWDRYVPTEQAQMREVA